MSDIWVGVDVSKARLDIAIRPTGETWSIADDASGIKQLTKAKKQTPSSIVLEAPAIAFSSEACLGNHISLIRSSAANCTVLASVCAEARANNSQMVGAWR